MLIAYSLENSEFYILFTDKKLYKNEDYNEPPLVRNSGDEFNSMYLIHRLSIDIYSLFPLSLKTGNAGYHRHSCRQYINL